MMLNMLQGILPEGPIGDAAAHLITALQNDPASAGVLTAHALALRPLLGAVQEGTKTPAVALMDWLGGYKRLTIGDTVRQAVLNLIKAIATNEKQVNANLEGVLPLIIGLLPIKDK